MKSEQAKWYIHVQLTLHNTFNYKEVNAFTG